jgi:RND superfamily putative drug exporter
MDYHVFILSRIRELWAGGASATDSIVDGVGKSAGVVTSAALIMVAVFSIFATLSMIDVKMLGVGLAAAVLIDATIVRGVVLPAALALLGKWAWYLPRWLSWLPGRSLACEGSPAPASAPEPTLPSRAPLRPAGVALARSTGAAAS